MCIRDSLRILLIRSHAGSVAGDLTGCRYGHPHGFPSRPRTRSLLGYCPSHPRLTESALVVWLIVATPATAGGVNADGPTTTVSTSPTFTHTPTSSLSLVSPGP